MIVVVEGWLDQTILEGFFYLNDSMILMLGIAPAQTQDLVPGHVDLHLFWEQYLQIPPS